MDDLWQVRFRSKENAKKAFGSKVTDDERRLKTLLVEDERPLGFPIHWQIFEIYPEPISAENLNASLRSHIASKSKITTFREEYLIDSALVRSNVQIRLWGPEARVYLKTTRRDHFPEKLANIAEDYRLDDAEDMLWKITIRQVRQGKRGVRLRDRSAQVTSMSSSYLSRKCISR